MRCARRHPISTFSADIFNLGAELPSTRRGPNKHEHVQEIFLARFEDEDTRQER